jgi:hypothetical protein
VAAAIGLLLLVWAFLAAIVSLFTGPAVARTRVVERVSVVPRDDANEYPAEVVPGRRRHFWSRSTQGTNI